MNAGVAQRFHSARGVGEIAALALPLVEVEMLRIVRDLVRVLAIRRAAVAATISKSGWTAHCHPALDGLKQFGCTPSDRIDRPTLKRAASAPSLNQSTRTRVEIG